MAGEVLSTGLKLIKQPNVVRRKFSLSRIPNLSEGRYTDFLGTNNFATTLDSFALGTNYEIQIRYKLLEFPNYNAIFAVRNNDNNKHIGIQFQNHSSHPMAVWIGIANTGNNGWLSFYTDSVVPQDNDYHVLNVKRQDNQLIAMIDDVVVIDVTLNGATSGVDEYNYSFGTNYSLSYDFAGSIDWDRTYIKVNNELMFGLE